MIIDLHCDTFIRMYNAEKDPSAFYENEYSIDVVKLKKGDVLAQCFAIYNSIGNGYAPNTMYEKIDYMLEGLKMYTDNVYIYSGYDDLVNNKYTDKICAIPTIEDLGPILDDIAHIDRLYELGFKVASITWNHENTLGYPNSKENKHMDMGLKKLGLEVVERMNQLNMIVDVSHLSDGGFYDVAKHCKKPFVATHSNARAVTDHPRNLTDDMIKTLSDAGGVMGINFFHQFLCAKGNVSRVSDMVKHIKHIKNIGGIDCIAIGSDFDGISGEMELYDASKYPILTNTLYKEKFTENEIEKITYKNVLRVLKDSE